MERFYGLLNEAQRRLRKAEMLSAAEAQKKQPKRGLVRSLLRFIWKLFLWMLAFLILVGFLFVALITQLGWWDKLKLGACAVADVGCK